MAFRQRAERRAVRRRLSYRRLVSRGLLRDAQSHPLAAYGVAISALGPQWMRGDEMLRARLTTRAPIATIQPSRFEAGLPSVASLSRSLDARLDCRTVKVQRPIRS